MLYGVTQNWELSSPNVDTVRYVSVLQHVISLSHEPVRAGRATRREILRRELAVERNMSTVRVSSLITV